MVDEMTTQNITIIQTPLTFKELESKLKKTFPGVLCEVNWRLGGATFKIKIWSFELWASFSESKMNFVDKTGGCLVTFTYVGAGNKKIEVKRAEVESMEQLEDFIKWCKEYLNGIVAAIERAFETPPESPPANIFGGTP